ncbi:hypothetical protein [Planococcus glaciei]|uniref:hypothetical protein n=1 Tax=Planococcus glaciei TaxID=459472 RepID=UPI001C73AF5B|nr:hypothetical protein [Planococcus glaciei]MBX0314818.1 hypothetical protein [Planococcus glaciei]
MNLSNYCMSNENNDVHRIHDFVKQFVIPSFAAPQRIDRGETAWIAIMGLGTIIFNQIFVTLVIAGLLSYA